MKIRIQVIKVYDVEADSIVEAYDMQTTDIEKNGKLIDVSTDHAESSETVDVRWI